MMRRIVIATVLFTTLFVVSRVTADVDSLYERDVNEATFVSALGGFDSDAQTEDDNGWSCEVDGNRVCGDLRGGLR